MVLILTCLYFTTASYLHAHKIFHVLNKESQKLTLYSYISVFKDTEYSMACESGEFQAQVYNVIKESESAI